MKQAPRVVGVTGFMGAGKDTLAGVLMRKGFVHISLSDILREEVKRRHQTPSIELLRIVGNELREAEGHGVLGKLACARIASSEGMEGAPKNHVITSIRHPAEVEELRRGCRGSFCLVFVDAPARLRFERVQRRARAGDMSSFEEFIAAENAQLASSNPAGQQLQRCKEIADVVFVNDKPSETEFEGDIEAWLLQFSSEVKRAK